MATRVSAHVRTGALVITMTGRWGVAQARLLRRALARCLVHLPPYVVVDCVRLHPTGMLPTLLPAMVLVGGRRRGVLMVVCAPTPVLTSLLRRFPGHRLALFPRLEDALEAVLPHHAPHGVRRAHLRLAPTPEAAAAARRLVRECCERWGIEEATENGQLVVSELVANATEHAGTDIDVTIAQRRNQLRIAVADRSEDLPDFRRAVAGTSVGAAALSVRGRGLPLVARSATGYGVLPGIDGKVVWATVALPRGPWRPLPRLARYRRWLSPARLLSHPPSSRPRPAYQPRPA